MAHYHYSHPHGRICEMDCRGPYIPALPDGRCDGSMGGCEGCYPTVKPGEDNGGFYVPLAGEVVPILRDGDRDQWWLFT